MYDACKSILDNKISKLIVFGKEDEFDDSFKTKNCQIIDIAEFKDLNKFASDLYELRKAKGMTLDKANELVRRADYFSMMLLKEGLADGVVAGATWSTADTLRPALQVIKTKKDKPIVTGITLMVKENADPKVFADVSLIENPTSENLADIAISGAEFIEKVLKLEPKVAMLSYSTKGSAKSEMVDKVRIATEIANKKSNYLIDGEMQVDANVLVFPDLNAGNIGYKLVARMGGYTAIGPIMLNFNKPVNDLSRGSNVEEIINTICITKLLV